MSSRFKLDENLGMRLHEILTAAGHEVATVREEGLQGGSDESLYEICRREGRCLVTLDLDFSDVLRFPPATSPGIVVLRPGREISLSILRNLIERLIVAMNEWPLEGRLWIVEPGRIRVRDGRNGPQS